jgi:hypothetical protein
MLRKFSQPTLQAPAKLTEPVFTEPVWVPPFRMVPRGSYYSLLDATGRPVAIGAENMCLATKQKLERKPIKTGISRSIVR